MEKQMSQVHQTTYNTIFQHPVARNLQLKHHYPDIAQRVIGTVVVNEQHMSEDPLLAQARAFYGATER